MSAKRVGSTSLSSATLCLTLLGLLLSPTSTAATIPFDLETIDPGSAENVGSYASMVFDASGNPHISYRSSSAAELRYARYDGSGWIIETVDDGGDDNVGWYTSLALDGAGNPRITYWDYSNQDLKYAEKNGSSWTVAALDTEGVVGAGTALALDAADEPHILYDGPAGDDLKYAYRSAGVWYFETVFGTEDTFTPSLVFDSMGNPHGSFGTGVSRDLKYCFRTGGTWTVEHVTGSSGDVGVYNSIRLTAADQVRVVFTDDTAETIRYAVRAGPGLWSTDTVIDSSGPYSYLDFQHDSLERPHVAYRDDFQNVRYAWRNGSVWERSVVDLSTDVGAYLSLILTDQDEPRLTYRDTENEALKYARRINGVWIFEWVDGQGNVGNHLDLARDGSGQLHVAYQSSHGAVLYATEIPGGWTHEIVDIKESFGPSYVSLAIDDLGEPRLAYCRQTGSFLGTTIIYAERNDGTWSKESVTAAQDGLAYTSLALDSSGLPRIAYYDRTDDNLVYASHDGVDWTLFTVHSPGDVGLHCSLAIDSIDHPHISYVDGTNEQLLYAHWTGFLWDYYTVGPADATESFTPVTDIRIGFHSDPHIAYVYNSDLMYARELWDTWNVEMVTSSEWVRHTLSLVVDDNDRPRILFFDDRDDRLEYAVRADDGWLLETVLSSVTFDKLSTSLVLDDDRNPRFALAEETTGALELARRTELPDLAFGSYPQYSSLSVVAGESIDVATWKFANYGGADCGLCEYAYLLSEDDVITVADVELADWIVLGLGGYGVADIAPAVLTIPPGTPGEPWADYDNDGDLDLLLTNAYTGDDHLFRNDGGGTFTDATPPAMYDPAASSTSAAWGDFDNDGNVDLYIARANKANLLLRNDGDGAWTDATAPPLDDGSICYGVAWADYDNDGDLDLYLANDSVSNKLFRNEGAGVFTDVTASPLDDAHGGRAVTWADYDNDGDLDLYLVNSDYANHLFRNDDGGSFSSLVSHVADSGGGGGAAWADYDNDGDLDLYLAKHGQGGRLFRNEGGDTFVDAAPREVGGDASINDIAWADYDDDGDLDLGLARNDGTQLLQNILSNGNHWLHVRLHGVISNRSGIGARVRVVAGGTSQMRVVGAETGYQSQGSLTAEFGLGTATLVDSLEIRWPSRGIQVLTAVTVDQLIDVTEAIQDWIDVTVDPVGETAATHAVAWGDYDGDGDEDLFLANEAGTANRLLANLGFNAFSDVTAAPLDDLGDARGAAWADHDNDGDLDLYVANAAGADLLLRNDGTAFTDVTAGPLDGATDSRSIAWIDYDGDGLLDLHVTRYGETDALYHNEGGDLFSDATTGPIGDTGPGQDAAWGDHDDDGDLDVYLVRNGQSNLLLRNDGAGAFVDVTGGALADAGNGQTAAWGDFDDDGDLDLYLVNDGQANRLLRNDGGAVFVDVSAPPFDDAGAGRSASWLDYDDDGDLDLHLTIAGAGSRLFRNDGGGSFVDATSPQLDIPSAAGAAAWADSDGDGDIDVYVASLTETNRLLRNETGAGNHWLHVKLIGTLSNASAIGARVSLLAGGSTQVREVTGAGGLRSQGSLLVEFGLGAQTTADEITVRWPSGQDQTVAGVAADQVIEIVESAWSDVTTEILSGGTVNTRSAAWGDYDGDGLVDLMLTNRYYYNFLLHNEGGGAFADATGGDLGSYLDDSPCGAWGDYDNDGDLDVLVSSSNGERPFMFIDVKLYQNTGTSWLDVTTSALEFGLSTAARDADWIDYDGDGDLDLYLVSNNRTNRLVRNDGAGVFTSVAAGPLGTSANGPEAAWADYDDDGDLDVYLVFPNTVPNALFRNDGGGSFIDVTTGPLGHIPETKAACWGDYDNDGDLDLYVLCPAAPNALLRNDGGGVFVDVATPPLNDAARGYGAAWGDYDNDGNLDLFVANQNEPNRLLRNNGGGVFTDEAAGTIMEQHDKTLSGAWADCDEDGDLDLFIVGEDENQLLLNRLPATGHWLHVDLVGTLSNRDAVGARVRLVADGSSWIRERSDDTGGLAESSPTLEFGLGAVTFVDSLIISWPSGIAQVAIGVVADQRITATESGIITGVEQADTPGPRFAVHPSSPNPFNASTTLRFELPERLPVTIKVYDVSGRLVRVLAAGHVMGPGPQAVTWDGRDDGARSVASGPYFFQLKTGPHRGGGRVMLIK